jgi:16S rRNA (uracil1498-N3)-methyltransferase
MSGPARGAPHFFVDPGDIHGDSAVLRGDDARHLAVVLRALPGTAVSLAGVDGIRYSARVASVHGGEVRLEIASRERVRRATPSIAVVQALPKGRKLDDVVQRLTEIGVDRIVPVHSRRSEVRLTPERAAKAVDRWRAVALAAAKQSRRLHLPAIADVGEWRQAFDRGSVGVVLWEEATQPFRDALENLPREASEIVVGVGPEGGLTSGEVAAAGLPAVTLGQTILRTETAALVAVSAILYAVGRLGT